MNFKSSLDIKNEWNTRIEAAEDKAIELQKLTQELAEALAVEKAEAFLEQAKEMIDNNVSDKEAGLRNLTAKEKSFYKAVEKTVLRQALTADETTILPTTTINRVFEDLVMERPILGMLDVAPAGLQKWLISTADNTATWGELTAAIAENVVASITEIDLTVNKLTAFFTIFKGIVSLGYAWLDSYIRTVIAEAVANGLEKAVINGTGKNEPIGMMRNVNSSTDGVYAEKTPVVITEITPTTYGPLIAPLTKNGKRTVPEVFLAVNPVDYLTKIIPAVSYRDLNGSYVMTFPYPTKVTPCVSVPQNKAVLGIPKKYMIGMSAVAINLYKETLATQDKDLFIGQLLGNGRPKDNESFVVLDITNLASPVSSINTLADMPVGDLTGDTKTK